MLFIDNNLLLPGARLHILNKIYRNDGQLFYIEKTTFRSVFANNSVFNLHFMKVSSENDNNFGYENITILVDDMPLTII
jgi:hypothetical protein